MTRGPSRICSEKGDLTDPNKWRGVSLIDIGSEAFSSILCERAFMIVKNMVHTNPAQLQELVA